MVSDWAKHRLLAVCVLAFAASGCGKTWSPFRHQTPDQVTGVPSPAERIANLRKLAEKAASTAPAEKPQVAAGLAEEIRKEDDPMIRTEIVRTIAVYPCPLATEVLRAALGDADADVRIAACDALGKRKDAEAARLLGGVLTGDIDKDVRFAAARALGESRDPAAIPALAAALEDSDPAMQSRARSRFARSPARTWATT